MTPIRLTAPERDLLNLAALGRVIHIHYSTDNDHHCLTAASIGGLWNAVNDADLSRLTALGLLPPVHQDGVATPRQDRIMPTAQGLIALARE